MSSPKPVLSRVTPLFCSNAAMLVFAAFSLTAVTCANANSDSNGDSTTTAYVDSIHKWGAWELDIEPAAGGLQQPSTQALNSRDARVSLRTNSFSALAPRDRSPVIFSTSSPIVPDVVPVTPPPPPVTPPRPSRPTTSAPPGATPPTTVSLP